MYVLYIYKTSLIYKISMHNIDIKNIFLYILYSLYPRDKNWD